MADMATTPSAERTLDEMQARHRKESRDLIATITGLKKQATKGEKKKKKALLQQCEEMERAMNERHQSELDKFNGVAVDQSSEVSPEELLAQLVLDTHPSPAAEIVSTGKQDTVESEGDASVHRQSRQKVRKARKKAAMEAIASEAASEAAQMPDLRKIELENMKMLQKTMGLVEKDITPDGHCLFAAISDQLAVRRHIKKSVTELRTLAAEVIRANVNTYSPFLFDEETMQIQDVDVYCRRLEETAVWGGDMEILALATHFDSPVTVVMSGRLPLRINETGKEAELMLAYYKHSYGLGEHYNSLR
ncbi:uncharacterized protein V1510DRAFT_250055 [Dipodascopsis tothii]|uniref:uncharacterized protein n=1 Tax=Dipodascopsis tothii TaxID=44089 RepID=UPI0034CE09CB